MSQPIPPAKLEHLLMVENAKRKQPIFDLPQAVRAALGATTTKEQMVSVASRLVALTNLLLVQPELQRGAIREGASVDLAVLKAAARAPLCPASRPALLLFDIDSFLAILAEECS